MTTTCEIKERAPISLPCANCTAESFMGESNFMLACCRTVYCPICIAYYLDEADFDGFCINTKCQKPAFGHLVFEHEMALNAYLERRRVEEQEEEELRALALQSLAALKAKAPEPKKEKPKKELPKREQPKKVQKKPVVKEEPEGKKPIVWSLEPSKKNPAPSESSSSSSGANRRPQKRRIHTEYKEPNPQRRHKLKYDWKAIEQCLDDGISAHRNAPKPKRSCPIPVIVSRSHYRK